MPSGKSKKSIKTASSSKFGQTSERQENPTGGLQKTRDKRKKRKSIKAINEEEEKYVQQLGTSIALLEQKNSRAQTLSPDKGQTQPQSKLGTQQKNLMSGESPAQKFDKSNPQYQHKRQPSQISISSTYNSKGRPLTSNQTQGFPSSQTTGKVGYLSSGGQDDPLPFSSPLIDKGSSSMKQSFNHSSNQGSTAVNDIRYKMSAEGSPVKPMGSLLMKGGPLLGSGAQAQSTNMISTPQLHNPNDTSNPQSQQYQYAIIPQNLQFKSLQQQQQFQHILQNAPKALQQELIAQQAHYQLQHQHQMNAIGGVNGLLNMSKQRGLVQNGVQSSFNIRNSSTNHRSQSTSKQTQGNFANSNSFQNNGKQIATKSPLYNSIQGIGGVQKNILGHQYSGNPQQVQQNQLPLAIFDMQITNHSDLMIQPNNFFQKSANSALYKLQNGTMHQGYSLIPSKQSQTRGPNIGVVLAPGQQYIVQRSNQYGLQNMQGQRVQNGYFYYEQPVQVSGKQMGIPIQQYAKMERQVPKRGPSQGLFIHRDVPNSYDQINPYQNDLMSSKEMNHEDLIKSALLHELMENQQVPTQLLAQNMTDIHNKQFLQSLLTSQEKLNEQLLQSQVVKAQAAPLKKASTIPFANAYVEDCYKFIVVAGNNSGLVRKAIDRREWWIEIPAVHSMFNFKWQPVSYGIKFERLSPMKPKPGEIGGNTNQFNVTGSQGSVEDIKQMVNHFEFHHIISEKAHMFNSMQKYCELSKENIFDICPVTFYVEITDCDKQQLYNQSLQSFVNFYQTLEDNRERIVTMKQQLTEILNKPQVSEEEGESSDQNQPQQSKHDFLNSINNKVYSSGSQQKGTKFKAFNFDKRQNIKYSFPMCHFDGFNLWLLKPTHLNRGRGIHVFRDLDTMHKLIKEYCQGKDEEQKQVPSSPIKDKSEKKPSVPGEESMQEGEPDIMGAEGEGSPKAAYLNEKESSPSKKMNPKKKSSQPAYKIKHNTFIIQKYIERPLLVFNRKFDLRVWVLIDQDFNLYLFKEGYLRTSSSEFSIDLSNVDDQYVHLTNNAVQKFAENYGSFEDGNQASYKRLQEIIDLQYPTSGYSVYNHLVPQMKELIHKSMFAVRKKIDPFKRKSCFELFGYDFMLDEDFNVWLIEVNTNPCIEESSELLKVYLPRMIEDMLRITIDVVFPKIKKQKRKGQSPQKKSQKIKNIHPVGGAQTLDKIEEEDHMGSKELIPEGKSGEGAEEETDPNKIANLKGQSRIHPVPGYSNTENMWEKITNLEKSEMPPKKNSNHLSQFLITVNDRQLKLKRNPLYKKILKEVQDQVDPHVPANATQSISNP